jgi:hypothetical protein
MLTSLQYKYVNKQTNTLSPSPKCFQSPSPRTSEKSADSDSDVRKALLLIIDLFPFFSASVYEDYSQRIYCQYEFVRLADGRLELQFQLCHHEGPTVAVWLLLLLSQQFHGYRHSGSLSPQSHSNVLR